MLQVSQSKTQHLSKFKHALLPNFRWLFHKRKTQNMYW